ncbi:MAG TPA: hypothetical protein EYH59_05055 [Pyrodictium sp.]|nr:hypothetical protein [Pyrodictium sp.]
MGVIEDVITAIINAVLVVLLAPLFEGIIRKVVARLQGRYGPPILQPYIDLAKLFNRTLLTKPATASDALYNLAPVLVFATIVVVAALVPTFVARPLTLADVLVIFYLMGLVRFVYSIASFNVANPFAVVGSAREHLLTLGVEPAALLAAIIAVLSVSSPSVSWVAASIPSELPVCYWWFIPALLGFIAALLADLALPPFDVAEAEQEISEGLLAEYGGPLLGLFKLAINCKRLVLLNLLFALFLPFGMAANYTAVEVVIGFIVYILKVLVAAVILSLIVVVAARLKIHDVVKYLLYSLAFSITAGIMYILGG